MQSSRKKLTSLLGGIAIVFAMMLFMPSAANATWGNYHDSCSSYQHGSKKHHGSSKHGSHGSKKHGSCKTKHGSKKHHESSKHESSKHGSHKHGSHKHGSYKHGSHKHGSHCTTSCSDYEKLVEKYKNLSEQYLAKYNSTHCYTYYRYYLCYAKKYEYYKKKLEACKPATPDCDQYKTIADQYKVKADQYKVYADKYLAAYNRCHYYCYYYYYACYIKKYNYYMDLYNQYMEKYNNCQAKNIYGEVHGSIYEDKDADKIKDADEYGMAGVLVLLTDANGTEYNTTTDATGHYTFTQIAKGAATVTVTDDAFPAYTELYTENNPATVIIESGKDANAGDVGYIFPEPSGSLTGKVFEDSDESGDFTDGEVGANGIIVVIVDKNGDEQSITTTDGSYHFDRVVAGAVDIAVSHLPTDADVSIGSLSFSRNVVAGQDNIATDVGYTLPAVLY